MDSQLEAARAHKLALLLLQIVLGGLVGGALALCGGWVGPLLTSEMRNGWNDMVGSVLGVLTGYAIGTPLGVIAAAALLRRSGRRLLCLLSGVLSGLAVLLIAEPLGLNRQPSVLILVYGLVVPMGALVGFYAGASDRK